MYEDGETRPATLFEQALGHSHRRGLGSCRNVRERHSLTHRLFHQEFVREYASTHFREDFAETFMVFLRHRRHLERFTAQPGVFRKLLASRDAVAWPRRKLGS